MKFFTAAWANGELPDEDYEAAFPAYAKHLSSLSLPHDVQRLVGCRLHDAVVETLARQGDILTLSLITGDLQRGYFSTNITYRGIDLAVGSEHLDALASDEAIEILYDEIDRDQARYVHRLLFSNYSHVGITFDSVVVSTSPRGTRERVRYRFTCDAAPVQVEGSVSGRRFYFRARHEEWSFAITQDPGVDPAELPDDHAGSRRGDFPDASYMPHDTAIAIIRNCLAACGVTPNC